MAPTRGRDEETRLGSGANGGGGSIKDPRFARLSWDSKFHKKPKKEKVVIDDRFKMLFEDSDEGEGGASAGRDSGRKKKRRRLVDKRGNPLPAEDPEMALFRSRYELPTTSGAQKKQTKTQSKDEGKKSKKTKGIKLADRKDEVENEEMDLDQRENKNKTKNNPDFARGEGKLRDSSSEDEDDSEDNGDEEKALGSGTEINLDEDEDLDLRSSSSSDDDDDDKDKNEIHLGGGGSSSSRRQKKRKRSASPSYSYDHDLSLQQQQQQLSESEQQQKLGSPTSRLAAVNLDWDNLTSLDLFVIFSSLLSPTSNRIPPLTEAPLDGKATTARSEKDRVARGMVKRVGVYASEFGRKRMREEEEKGPGFVSKEYGKPKGKEGDEEDDSGDEDGFGFEDGRDGEVDEAGLRKYQLERLRYYYAIVETDSVASAQHLYSELDGSEIERTANVFDLSFVPNDLTFEPEHLRDEANADSQKRQQKSTNNESVGGSRSAAADLLAGYEGIDFVTDALRHSRVHLTWDSDDPVRLKKLSQATGLGLGGKKLSKKEIEELDLKEYLASEGSSSGEEEEEEEEESEESDRVAGESEDGKGNEGKKRLKEKEQRERIRKALGIDRINLLDNADNDDDDLNGLDTAPPGLNTKGKKKRNNGDDDVDMEVTFAPAFSTATKKTGLDHEDDGDEKETTLDVYRRKEKERKKKRQEKRAKKNPEKEDEDDEEVNGSSRGRGKTSATAGDDDDENDEFFTRDEDDDAFEKALARHDAGIDSEEGEDAGKRRAKGKGKDGKKKAKKSKDGPQEEENGDGEREKAEMALLFDEDGDEATLETKGRRDTNEDDDPDDGNPHFDMKAIIRSEKDSKLTGKAARKAKAKAKKRAQQGDENAYLTTNDGDGFEIDLKDERFKNVFEDFEMAVDPSNPSFQSTRSMKKLLLEGQKRRNKKQEKTREELLSREDGSGNRAEAGEETSLKDLVEAAKRRGKK